MCAGRRVQKQKAGAQKEGVVAGSLCGLPAGVGGAKKGVMKTFSLQTPQLNNAFQAA
jgi:hypothetical protein